MQVAIHKCKEAMLGISLHSYLYPKLAKTICLSYYFFCFLCNKTGEEGNRFCLEVGGLGDERAQTMIHM
jgi:hypothetical protein